MAFLRTADYVLNPEVRRAPQLTLTSYDTESDQVLLGRPIVYASPLSPCIACTGSILVRPDQSGRTRLSSLADLPPFPSLPSTQLYAIPRVVIAENANFVGGEALLRSPPSLLAPALQQPRIVLNADLADAKRVMAEWIASPEGAKVWWEDIGLVGEEER
jgi:hypothetical protein